MIRLAIHGGAGVIDREQFGGDREQRYREALRDITTATHDRLRNGASALDAVELAVRLLEDCPYFNAGHGAVLNSDGVAEMDAAVMDGRERRCGAVAAMKTTRYPVSLARAVMEQTEHVMLAGTGADRFGASVGLEQVDADYFITDDRRRQLTAAAREGRISLDHDEKYGTVGAVARDADGHLAAATSTGGMTNKLPGRVGDTPVIGSGTWADNATCAVSGTGHGEYFMRSAMAYDIHARMAYTGDDLDVAASAALKTVASMGGSGGVIAIAADGTVALPFNSPGMYRGWVDASGEVRIGIYQDDG
ncbi:MAG: isoaspartyl peptidase/L-asparaginase [Pseudomonadota bacterium]